jgi:hypothetical protein
MKYLVLVNTTSNRASSSGVSSIVVECDELSEAQAIVEKVNDSTTTDFRREAIILNDKPVERYRY